MAQVTESGENARAIIAGMLCNDADIKNYNTQRSSKGISISDGCYERFRGAKIESRRDLFCFFSVGLHFMINMLETF